MWISWSVNLTILPYMYILESWQQYKIELYTEFSPNPIWYTKQLKVFKKAS